ncbi:hypothetical protein Gpo141_00002158 [Globisporangium polare]
MVPKKKAKKKSGSAADGAAGDDPSMFDNTPPLVIAPEVVHYVTLDMRLLNWSYLNFKLRTKTTTRLFAIKKRHGPISDLKICKGHFSEANEMLNDMDTLQDYGIEGAPEIERETISIIHYDFKPQQHDNPLLLATEQQ